ncbi:enoyl-CoA hydratase/isomerase family protein [Amycolatopsis acidicola]|uniref:Enoyl-CoA hydratase/isomerase family protein n=1 Tax=Amycolatopsis acidicola TaxID=2596893 RepID=A0A5N0V0N7_9PSEU|nr:enoyl-CoA hydratase/isomerase family protein [Amycolatopsis acidicola]KAA9157334.1 enoyl-CoA hydratase/isomerase family protein [Amycolatopsis acidicola]
MADVLLVERRDRVAVLTLNRPDKLNALNQELHRALYDVFGELAGDESIGAIVVTGAGERAFSAGYDVRELEPLDEAETLMSNLRREPYWARIFDFPKPVVAALNGFTLGGGAMLALCADVRIGCRRTVFRVTAVPYLGVMATWNLPPLVGMGRAKEWLMTARPVEADEGLAAGLLNHVVPDDEVVAKAIEVAAAIAGHPPAALSELKRLIHDNAGRSLPDGAEAENSVMHHALAPKSTSELFAGFLASRGD